MDKALALEYAGQIVNEAVTDPAACAVDELRWRASEIDAALRCAADQDFAMFTDGQWLLLYEELERIEAELSTRKFGGVA